MGALNLRTRPPPRASPMHAQDLTPSQCSAANRAASTLCTTDWPGMWYAQMLAVSAVQGRKKGRPRIVHHGTFLFTWWREQGPD